MAAAHLTLLVAPELSFGELESQLTVRGYVLSDQSADPLVPGEPEWAVFENGSDCRIHYSFNPVASFRALELRGDGAAAGLLALAGGLPTLDWVRARSFLMSTNPRDQWLGILAAEHFGDVRLRPMIEILSKEGQPRIAAAARQALASLPESSAAAAVNGAWESLLAEQGRRPDLNVLFRHLPSVEVRRQVLRWTGREGEHGGAAVERLLRTALADDDPEVRVTAMLVAALLGQRAVAGAVRDAPVPDSTADGAPPGDRLYYRTLRRLAARYLAMPDSTAPNEAATRRRHAFETALRGGRPVDSDETLLWHALMTPLDLGDPPAVLPVGVVETADGYELTVPDGSIELCRVNAVPHWLGGQSGGPAEPVRQQTPTAPFFISSAVTAIPGQAGRRWSGSFAAAAELVRRLGAATGLPLRLPSADEREMAARGPDGRFYPWGIGLQPGWQEGRSPWGLAGWGEGDEWAIGQRGSEPVLVGGTEPWPAARRCRADERASAEVRFLLPS